MVTVQKFLTHMTLLLMYKTISAELCLSGYKETCHLCPPADTVNCIPLDKAMRILHVGSNVNLNYNSFVSSGIKIIQEMKIVTYYACDDSHYNYMQVNSFTFYPYRMKLSLTQEPSPASKEVIYRFTNSFQMCLRHYCANQKNHRLTCSNLAVRSLEFEFDAFVNPECLQNITYAFIQSQFLKTVKRNAFFSNAYNLVYLVIQLSYLDDFDCEAFEYLRILRDVNLRFLQSKWENETKQFRCIFDSNPKLTRVQINYKSLWNHCPKNIVDIVILVICALMILCVFIFILYMEKIWSPEVIDYENNNSPVENSFELYYV